MSVVGQLGIRHSPKLRDQLFIDCVIMVFFGCLNEHRQTLSFGIDCLYFTLTCMSLTPRSLSLECALYTKVPLTYDVVPVTDS